jgi:hypothetical protein
MQLKKLLIGAAISMAIAAPFPASAFNIGEGSSFPSPWEQEGNLQALSLKPCLNDSLGSGSYLFGDFNKSGKGFFDSWSFSLAESSDVTISLFDFNLPDLPFLVPDAKSNGKGHHKGHHYDRQQPQQSIFTSLFDNRFLTASLFDEGGNLMGTIGENGVLSLSGLQANSWYTLTVSGKAAGLVGGLYYGSVDVTPVPLGDTLPLFGSALIALTIVRRRRARQEQANANS